MSLLFALALAAAPAPAAFERDEETPLLHFHYGWPAVAQGAPALRARLTREMAQDHRDAIANARRTRDDMVQEFVKTWESAGNNAVLLSLTAALGTSGGAHPNTSYHALLWNLATDRAVSVASAMGPLGAYSARYCAELDRQRAENRAEEPAISDAEDPFSACPDIAQQVLAPADTDGNGRMDSLRILLGPYVAGPYTEGDYAMDLPLTPEDVARVAETYRQGFETPGDRRLPIPDQ